MTAIFCCVGLPLLKTSIYPFMSWWTWVVFLKRFIYLLKSRVTGRKGGGRDREIFYLWFASQMATMARVGPVQNQEAAASSRSPRRVQEPKQPGLSAVLPGQRQFAEWKGEQPGFKLEPIWDACAIGGNFTSMSKCCPLLLFKIMNNSAVNVCNLIWGEHSFSFLLAYVVPIHGTARSHGNSWVNVSRNCQS